MVQQMRACAVQGMEVGTFERFVRGEPDLVCLGNGWGVAWEVV